MFPIAHAWLLEQLVDRPTARALPRLCLARYALFQSPLAYAVAS